MLMLLIECGFLCNLDKFEDTYIQRYIAWAWYVKIYKISKM